MSPLSHGEMVQMARMHGNSCVICGEEIPEGRMVCPLCEKQVPKRDLSYGKKLIRLIDADALRGSLFESSQFDTYNDYSMVLDTIDLAPTIEERNKGKWVKLSADSFHCRLCGHTFTVIQGRSFMNYCPSCGTDMGEDTTK